MNERILELAKLAEKYADEETNAFTDDSGQWKVIWNETYDKKFAELIIKECTNMLPEDSIRKDGVHMYYVIREHFGITPFRGDGE